MAGIAAQVSDIIDYVLPANTIHLTGLPAFYNR